ncbi:TetR/AcrR family transcriptional regulator [Amycolatopsis benzoatilytica]|uniref:TetR/AcrR family transcriptional regulator n=1 Tax=Amycolatopsis benzoatilytica TaxID=346045 RepID=UPI00037A4D1F|nr:TetR/AcrR family transcriptional regulator [Amycolatopsis benzoatilytica]
MSFPPRYRTARAKSRGEASGEASREKAVKVALELFAASGFKGTSIAKVAEKTGLSQSGLLHHFPSKAALLSAVLEERDAEDGQFLSSAGEPPLGWAAFDSLAALVARNSTRPHLVGLFVRLSAEAIEPSHPAHEWLKDHYAGIEAWLTDAIRTGQERGEIRADAPVRTIVHTTVAVLDGLQQQWLLNPDRVSMVGEFAAHVETLRQRWS